MESTLLSLDSSTVTILSLPGSRILRSTPPTARILNRPSSSTRHLIDLQARNEFPGPVDLRRNRLQFRAFCAASDGGGPRDAGDEKAGVVVDNESSGLDSDVIILDVEGMMCGGCEASVKRILESQPQVSSASANHTTKTAVVWPVSEAKSSSSNQWQRDIGEALAKHLTTCGFTSNLRDSGSL